MAPDTKVKIACSVVPYSRDWSAIRPDVERQLPLTDLQWKPTSRPLRTIASLPIELVDVTTETLQRARTATHSTRFLLERPILHLLFIHSEDGELYRTSLRQQIREWIDSVTASGSVEYLLVHVTTNKQGTSKFYQRKSSLLEKIRTDFGTSKRERCTQIALGRDADTALWDDFSARVKDGVMASFDSTVVLLDENVRRADSQRQLQGWQYLSFFRQKEVLADLFQAMRLWEDALLQYDELEASFFQALKDGHITWANTLGNMSQSDDAISIVDDTAHDYRDMIEKDSIGLFNFRIYLFARQARMLLALNLIDEVARRGAFFLSTFARTLAKYRESLGRFFTESWTFSAVFSVLEACERATRPGDRAALPFQRCRAELLDLARKQLEKLGLAAGHLPFQQPFTMSLEEVENSAQDSFNKSAMSKGISRSDLLEALDNMTTFDDQYLTLTNKTLEAFRSAGRKRSAYRLQSCIAAFERARGRSKQSERTFARLSHRYVELRWNKLESLQLAHCIRLQEELGLDRERLLSSLALLRAGTEVIARKWSLECIAEDVIGKRTFSPSIADGLLRTIRSISSTLTKDFAAIAFPCFSVTAFSGAGFIDPKTGGLGALAVIESGLPCPVEIDEIRLKLHSPSGSSIWFTGGACTLHQGRNSIAVHSMVLVQGLCTLDLSQIRFGRIIFQYSHRAPAAQNLAPDIRTLPVGQRQPKTVFPSGDEHLFVHLEPHDTVKAGDARQVRLVVTTNDQDAIDIVIRRLNPNETSLDLTSLQASEHVSDQAFAVTQDSLDIRALAPSTGLEFYIKLLVRAQTSARIIESFLVEYALRASPKIKRTFRADFAFYMDLPFMVDIREYHRASKSAIHFDVQASSGHLLEIKSAALVRADGAETASVPRAFLHDRTRFRSTFLLEVDDRSAIDYKYELIYRRQMTDADQVLSDLMRTAMRTDPESIELYRKAIASWRKGEEYAQDRRDVDALRDPRFRLVEKSWLRWQTLILPVALQRPEIVCSSEVRTEKAECVVGVPFKLTFEIESKHGKGESDIDLAYELLCDEDDWLVSGKTKGNLASNDRVSASVTAVALRAGIRPLPRVFVRNAVEDKSAVCVSHALTAAKTLVCHPRGSFATFTLA